MLALIVGHSWLSDLTGRPCDYTAPVFALLHKLTFIPMYDRAAAADKAAASRPAALAAPAVSAAPAPANVAESAATNGAANGAKKRAGKGKKKEL